MATKRCALTDNNGNCHRETITCRFSYDCFGEYTKEAVDTLRTEALEAHKVLIQSKKDFVIKVKAFGKAQQRLTEKESEWHLIDCPNQWWKFWATK